VRRDVLSCKYRRRGMRNCKGFKVIHLAPSPLEREVKVFKSNKRGHHV